MTVLRIAVALLLLTSLGGCMTVQIDSGTASARTVRHFGILRIDVDSPDTAVVGAISGLGVAATPMGWSAGYVREHWAAMGPDCRAVLWIDDTASLEQVRRALSTVAGTCLIGPGIGDAKQAFLSPIADNQEQAP